MGELGSVLTDTKRSDKIDPLIIHTELINIDRGLIIVFLISGLLELFLMFSGTKVIATELN